VRNLKSNRILGIVLLVFGAMSLLRTLDNPRLSTLRGSDVVALTGAGACLGVGLLGLLARLNLRRD
jgi:hypothetical protein